MILSDVSSLNAGAILATLLHGSLLEQECGPLMPTEPALLLSDILRRCRSATRLLLGLNYDATLVPIASRIEDARPSLTVLNLLTQLTRLPSVSVAVLSGQPIRELQELLPVPGLTYVGTHGLEINTAKGHTHRVLPPGAFTAVIARLRREITARVKGYPGIVIKDKQQALALHYRLASPSEGAQAVTHFLTVVTAYQRRGFLLEIVHGKYVIEVRPHGVNKGRALQYLLLQEGKGTLPLYIGDDVTDEDAFQALNSRGISFVVSDQPRPSTARYTLHTSDEVIEFLTALCAARQEDQR